MNSGKCNEEVLNRTEQATRAKRALNSLLLNKYFSVNTKKRIFYTVTVRMLIYSWEILTLN